MSTTKTRSRGIQSLAVRRKGEIYLLRPEQVQLVEGFNVRRDLGDLVALAQLFRAPDDDSNPVGIRMPLRGHMDGAIFKVTDGERRYRAMHIAIEKGWLKPEDALFPVVNEPRSYSATQRIVDMLQTGEGSKPLTMYERALAVVKLAEEEKLSRAQISKRTGKTRVDVENCLLLQKFSANLEQEVAMDRLSMSLAVELTRRLEDDTDEQDRLLQMAKRNAKDGKITAKHFGKWLRAPKETPTEKLAHAYQTWLARGGAGVVTFSAIETDFEIPPGELEKFHGTDAAKAITTARKKLAAETKKQEERDATAAKRHNPLAPAVEEEEEEEEEEDEVPADTETEAYYAAACQHAKFKDKNLFCIHDLREKFGWDVERCELIFDLMVDREVVGTAAANVVPFKDTAGNPIQPAEETTSGDPFAIPGVEDDAEEEPEQADDAERRSCAPSDVPLSHALTELNGPAVDLLDGITESLLGEQKKPNDRMLTLLTITRYLDGNIPLTELLTWLEGGK